MSTWVRWRPTNTDTRHRARLASSSAADGNVRSDVAQNLCSQHSTTASIRSHMQPARTPRPPFSAYAEAQIVLLGIRTSPGAAQTRSGIALVVVMLGSWHVVRRRGRGMGPRPPFARFVESAPLPSSRTRRTTARTASGKRGSTLRRWAASSRETPPYPGRRQSPSHTLFATSFDDKRRQLSIDVRW